MPKAYKSTFAKIEILMPISPLECLVSFPFPFKSNGHTGKVLWHLTASATLRFRSAKRYKSNGKSDKSNMVDLHVRNYLFKFIVQFFSETV